MTGTTVAVVVHYWSESVIEAGVAALLNQSLPCQVLVVANSAMAPDLREHLEDTGARVLQLEHNVGFAEACNAGVRAAGDSDFVWFVNPDVRCDPSCHAVLRSRTGPATATAPAIRTGNGDLEHSVKSRAYVSPVALLARELIIGRLTHVGSPTPPKGETSVAMLSGACLFLRRSDFQRVGGFDAGFFLYGEDLDLSLRLRAAGVDLRYVPDARVVHVTGTGAGGASPSSEVWEIKGRESRRAHSRLLEVHVSPAAARRYERGLRLVLPTRIALGRLRGSRGVIARDRAALAWVNRSG